MRGGEGERGNKNGKVEKGSAKRGGGRVKGERGVKGKDIWGKKRRDGVEGGGRGMGVNRRGRKGSSGGRLRGGGGGVREAGRG